MTGFKILVVGLAATLGSCVIPLHGKADFNPRWHEPVCEWAYDKYGNAYQRCY